jgi:hypothetical protein
MRCNPVYWQPAFGHGDFLAAYPAKNQTVGTIGLGNDANEAVQENQFKSGGNEEDECAGSRTRRWLNFCMATKMQDTLGHPLGDPTFGYPLNPKGAFRFISKPQRRGSAVMETTCSRQRPSDRKHGWDPPHYAEKARYPRRFDRFLKFYHTPRRISSSE